MEPHNNKKLNLAYKNLPEIPQDITGQFGLFVEDLDLTHNRISDLKWLLDYPQVGSLVLDHNNITSHVKMPELPQLHTLWVNQNKITNLTVFIGTLAKNCPNLRILSMMNNEAAPSYFNNGSYPQYVDYRHYVISKLPKLEILDDKKVETRERQEAERIYRPVTRRKSKIKKDLKQAVNTETLEQ